MQVVLYISIRFQSCKALFETPCISLNNFKNTIFAGTTLAVNTVSTVWSALAV